MRLPEKSNSLTLPSGEVILYRWWPWIESAGVNGVERHFWRWAWKNILYPWPRLPHLNLSDAHIHVADDTLDFLSPAFTHDIRTGWAVVDGVVLTEGTYDRRDWTQAEIDAYMRHWNRWHRLFRNLLPWSCTWGSWGRPPSDRCSEFHRWMIEGITQTGFRIEGPAVVTVEGCTFLSPSSPVLVDA